MKKRKLLFVAAFSISTAAFSQGVNLSSGAVITLNGGAELSTENIVADATSGIYAADAASKVTLSDATATAFNVPFLTAASGGNPVGVTINATTSGTGSISIATEAAKYTAGAANTPNNGELMSRYYEITENAYAGSGLTLDITYDAAELSAGDENKLNAYYDNMGTWVLASGVLNTTNKEVTAIPLTLGTQTIWELGEDMSVGIDDIAANQLVSLYPNPANDVVTLKLIEPNSVANLSVHDVTGKVVFSQQISAKTSINTSNWKNGMYYLSVTDKDVVKTTPLLITH